MINFIANLKSGKGRGKKVLDKLLAFCNSSEINYSVHITKAPKDAIELAKQLSGKEIVVVGGDGTFSEVLNGIDNFENTTVGFIPSGRGNDFAKAAGFSPKPVEALKTVLEGKTSYCDFIEVGGKRCLNVCGAGLDVSVIERLNGKAGKLTYLKSLVWNLFNFKPFAFKVVVDGVELELEKANSCIMVGICNGTDFGAGIRLSPLSKIDDGYLDLIIMRLPKRILPALLKFRKGKHMGKYYTTHIPCKSVTVTALDQNKNYPIQIDGEIFHDTPLDCKVISGKLKVFR